ncbi:hypothetical protein NDU88_003585 [Pleurodeles waltl]|uniref:Uncharacterized protein n=1 Tax=Pleurodeles waltl TaxID=8319 RepID=A0AAV7VG71_PLEWA|nr:hypothetical protein NDU88_003585 [Pleurodeles waltl]
MRCRQGLGAKAASNPEGGCLPGPESDREISARSAAFLRSGARPSLHHALGQKPAAQDDRPGMRGMQLPRTRHAHDQALKANKAQLANLTAKNAKHKGNPRSPETRRSEDLTDRQQ